MQQINKTGKHTPRIPGDKKETTIKVKVEKDWDHWNARFFKAEVDMIHEFQLLQTVLANKESTHTRGVEVH